MKALGDTVNWFIVENVESSEYEPTTGIILEITGLLTWISPLPPTSTPPSRVHSHRAELACHFVRSYPHPLSSCCGPLGPPALFLGSRSPALPFATPPGERSAYIVLCFRSVSAEPRSVTSSGWQPDLWSPTPSILWPSPLLSCLEGISLPLLGALSLFLLKLYSGKTESLPCLFFL